MNLHFICGENLFGSFAGHSWASLTGWNDEEQLLRANLLRHIFGNPFRSYPAPAHWPSTVTSLAEAMYQGQDCMFALHDALVETGHPDLADHFRQEPWHPNGCWTLDLILQKK